MANWRRRRQGGEFRDQETYRVRSDYGRPSQSVETWKLTVPSWEKKFCWAVGAIPWRKFLENKRYVHLCKDVLDWDDSAGEEAFNNAKSRFWAKLNRLPCHIPVPDPDTNVDPVDWDAAVDLDLYSDLDLEKEREPYEDDDNDNNNNNNNNGGPEENKYVFLSEALLLDPTVPCTGWGDLDDDDATADPPRADDGWGDGFDRPGHDRLGWAEPRLKGGPRFHSEDRGHRGRRKRDNVNVAPHQKHPLRQWNIKSCAQVS